MPYIRRLLRLSAATAILAMASCSNCSSGSNNGDENNGIVIDSDGGNNDGNCAANEEFNPISGECQPKAVGPGDKEEEFPTGTEDLWAEEDEDSIPDRLDNCPYVANEDQLDTDRDGIGDVCDNCPMVQNPAQTDSTGDGTGDACSDVPVGEICGNQQASFAVLKPNIHILFDKSGSMGEYSSCQDPRVTNCCPNCSTNECCERACCVANPVPWPIDQAKTALDAVADALAEQVRFGMSAFPEPPGNNGTACESSELLPMGEHTAAQVKQSYAGLFAFGGTPTGTSLYQVRTQGRLNDAADPQDAGRAKAVILITDGEPNNCENIHPAVFEARALFDAGINTYVVGFRSAANESTLNAIAQAGGTNNPNDAARNFYVADDTQTLVDTISAISESLVECSYILDPKPDDTNKIWVKLNGQYLPRNGYTYESSTATLQLSGAACDQLKGADPSMTSLEIILGCPEECDPTKFWGCCREEAETCRSDADCCFDSCNNGVCEDPCRPTGVSCVENGDCCSGVCAGSPGEAICIAQ